MVPFDVVSIFMSIPLYLASETTRKLLTGTLLSVTTDSLMDWINRCFKKYVQLSERFYGRVRGMSVVSLIPGFIAEAACSNPLYSWVTYFILSNICHFSQLVYLIYSPFVRFINFCHLINLSSSYQSFVIFSPLIIYSLFYVIYSPYKCTCTTHQTTTLSLIWIVKR